jgi:hypothetical protein
MHGLQSCRVCRTCACSMGMTFPMRASLLVRAVSLPSRYIHLSSKPSFMIVPGFICVFQG